MRLEINVVSESKLVEVWLTRAERDDPAVREQLKPLYAAYRQKKYTVAVYASGERELYPSVLDLLAYNKTRTAELAVRGEKKARASAMER